MVLNFQLEEIKDQIRTQLVQSNSAGRWEPKTSHSTPYDLSTISVMYILGFCLGLLCGY